MENKELQAALDLCGNPQLLKKQLEKDLLLVVTTDMSDNTPSEEIADELLIGIAESLDDVNPHYKTMRQQLLKKQDEQHRDLSQAIDLAGKAYGLVKDHWAEVFFILTMLNNKGYLDKVKKNPTLKPFFDTLFDKK